MNLNALKNTQDAYSGPTLKQFHYRALNKRQKGIVIRFLLQVTAYSRQQLTLAFFKIPFSIRRV
jgi:hypothetical protein